MRMWVSIAFVLVVLLSLVSALQNKWTLEKAYEIVDRLDGLKAAEAPKPGLMSKKELEDWRNIVSRGYLVWVYKDHHSVAEVRVVERSSDDYVKVTHHDEEFYKRVMWVWPSKEAIQADYLLDLKCEPYTET